MARPFSPKWYSVFFTSPPKTDPSAVGVESHLISLIDTAKKSLAAAVFEFDLQTVADALCRAQRRGVLVRLVYDNQFAEPKIIRRLKRCGIATVPDNRSAFMHNKFFVIDQKCVWTGSFNITQNSSSKNNENAVVIHDRFLAKNYLLEFDEMFAGQFGVTSPDNTTDLFFIDGTRVENFFAPEAEVMKHIVSLVNQAQDSVCFLAFSFTDKSLADALIEKLSAGLSVQGVFEKRGSLSKYSQYRRLRRAGADVKQDLNPGTMHHKVIIIDKSLVVFGSYNFSSNAAQVNDENLLIIYDRFLADQYFKEFLKIYRQASKPKKSRPNKRSP